MFHTQNFVLIPVGYVQSSSNDPYAGDHAPYHLHKLERLQFEYVLDVNQAQAMTGFGEGLMGSGLGLNSHLNLRRDRVAL